MSFAIGCILVLLAMSDEAEEQLVYTPQTLADLAWLQPARGTVQRSPAAAAPDVNHSAEQHVAPGRNAVKTRLKIGEIHRKISPKKGRKLIQDVYNETRLRARWRNKSFYDKEVVFALLKGATADPRSLSHNVKAHQMYITTYNVSVPVSYDFECVYVAVKPKPRICLYPNSVDKFISASLRSIGVWEQHIIRTFQNILYGNPDIGVIDIGANIGMYSILAASMGHHVIAVEPFKGNLQRLHQSIQIGGLQAKIKVLRNVVSNSRDVVTLVGSHDNQGAVRVQDTGKACDEEGCAVLAIHMDDILGANVSFRQAVMKIDIEGHEAKAFAYSQELFKTVFVAHIFMEWQILRSHFRTDIHVSADKTSVEDLIARLLAMGYVPFSVISLGKLDSRDWYGWPDDIWWKHELEEYT